jgi:tetratricopeptide (TPR) repeat protein
MDSLITAASQALAVGDPFRALNLIKQRDDPPALALRGIAFAQLGDLTRARELIRNAGRAFGSREPVSRARCVVAEAEIAFASRDIGWQPKALDAARVTLEAHGDLINAAHARYLAIRRLALIGRLDEAERALNTLSPARLPPALRATHELATAGIAMRRLNTKRALTALERALHAAREAAIPALMAEVDNARQLLDAPAARLITRGTERSMRLKEVEALFASKTFIVDAIRYEVRQRNVILSLARRPVLFILARTLAEAWPADVARSVLIERAFRMRRADETHRARLRVEMGRLRKSIRAVAEVNATDNGFALVALRAREVAVLARPVEEKHAAVLAFLADGEAWSSSGLALALRTSQRAVQRALDTLAAAGKTQSFGRGRARRWTMPPLPGFTTTLLLPAPLPGD